MDNTYLDNPNQETTKNDSREESSSFLSDAPDGEFFEIPFQAGKTIVNAIKTKGDGWIDSEEKSILDTLSEPLSSVKDIIGEHSKEVLEGITGIAGNVTNQIIDFVSDIDL